MGLLRGLISSFSLDVDKIHVDRKTGSAGWPVIYDGVFLGHIDRNSRRYWQANTVIHFDMKGGFSTPHEAIHWLKGKASDATFPGKHEGRTSNMYYYIMKL
jgi:hypothetical protein